MIFIDDLPMKYDLKLWFPIAMWNYQSAIEEVLDFWDMNGVDSWDLNGILVYITLSPLVFFLQFVMENWLELHI